jgi:Tfp pilus assembly protein PilF
MSAPEPPLTDLAVAILDGTPVDWAAAEADANADERAVLEELRVLEAVAGSRRRAGTNAASGRSALPAGYWGRLRLIGRIGGGSFGDVYQAWDAQLHREVAVKFIPVAAGPADDGSAIVDEGRLLARVRHPGVVTVYDVQVRGPWAALCMEFVDGETLEQRVRRDGPLSADAVIDIGVQLSEAVAAVHDAGVLHRDVKAANVVVQGDRRVMLTDFGAGRTVEGGGADLTGTPLYLAPEVLSGGAATAQSDIYSLGVLLHFALTGTLPVTGDTLAGVRNAHAERARAANIATAWPPAVPAGLGAVVDRALDPRPERRHQSAVALAAALRASASSGRSRPWLWTAAAALALVTLGAGGWVVARGRAPARTEAHTLYVRGVAALDRFTPETTRVALQLFERVLAIDPGHAAAHAAVASIYLQQRPAIPNLTAEAALDGADAAAARALALDDALPEAHLALALVKSARFDRAGADRAFRRAIETGPGNVRAREQYAQWLSMFGRFDEALAQARAAEALEPLSPRSVMAVASVLRFARRYDLAIEQARKALVLDASFPAAWLNLGHNYLGLGRFAEAIDAYQRAGRPNGNLGHALAVAGRVAEAQDLLATLEAQYATTGLGAGDIAQVYSGLGNRDRAFFWLARMERAQAGPPTLKVAAVWDPLRADPRFPAELAKYGLAD